MIVEIDGNERVLITLEDRAEQQRLIGVLTMGTKAILHPFAGRIAMGDGDSVAVIVAMLAGLSHTGELVVLDMEDVAKDSLTGVKQIRELLVDLALISLKQGGAPCDFLDGLRSACEQSLSQAEEESTGKEE